MKEYVSKKESFDLEDFLKDCLTDEEYQKYVLDDKKYSDDEEEYFDAISFKRGWWSLLFYEKLVTYHIFGENM